MSVFVTENLVYIAVVYFGLKSKSFLYYQACNLHVTVKKTAVVHLEVDIVLASLLPCNCHGTAMPGLSPGFLEGVVLTSGPKIMNNLFSFLHS